MSRFLLLTLAIVVGLSAGCRARVSNPGGTRGSKPDAARKQAESLALSGVKGAAEAQATIFIATNVRERDQNPTHTTPALALTPSTPAASDLPQPKALPRPGAPPIIRERIVSAVPAANESDADKEAILAAQEIIERRLAELDPPVKYRPSANEVEKEFLRRDSRTMTIFATPRARVPRRCGSRSRTDLASVPRRSAVASISSTMSR